LATALIITENYSTLTAEDEFRHSNEEIPSKKNFKAADLNSFAAKCARRISFEARLDTD
jgi:hypothetical protein